jgi:uncharacterized spore protein YtfJ
MEPTADMASIVHEIAATLEREGNVRTVFGEPLKLDTRTVIPVASVAIGAGGGGARVLGAAVDTLRRWLWRGPVHVEPGRSLVGGAGAGIQIQPMGFLCEDNGRVVFTRIDQSGTRR